MQHFKLLLGTISKACFAEHLSVQPRIFSLCDNKRLGFTTYHHQTFHGARCLSSSGSYAWHASPGGQEVRKQLVRPVLIKEILINKVCFSSCVGDTLRIPNQLTISSSWWMVTVKGRFGQRWKWVVAFKIHARISRG